MTKDALKKSIVEKAKREGLSIAEDSVERIAKFAVSVVTDVVAYTENTYDDMVWAAVKVKAEEILLELADKIDESDNE